MKTELSISENELNSIKCVLDWINDRHLFIENVKKLEDDSLRALIGLLVAYGDVRKISADLLVFSCDQLLRIINCMDTAPKSSSQMVFIIDLLHVYAYYGLWKENNWQTLETITISALQEQKEFLIENLFRLYSRLYKTAKFSSKFLHVLVDFTHKIDTNSKMSIESLILLEKFTKINSGLNEEIIHIVHDTITKCSKSKTGCDNCLTIMSHFIEHFLNKSPPTFLKELVMEGATSNVISHRKQSNYILKKLVKSSIEQNNFASFINSEAKYDTIAELESVWETYFMALESLLEVQSHLISSTLDQYIDKIVEFIPLCWVKSIFILVLNQNSISIVKYGLRYLIESKIIFDDEPKLSNYFFNALNVTGLYIEDEYGFIDKLSTFLCENLRAKTSFIADVQWKKVPAYILLNSWLRAMKVVSVKPLDQDAINFITSCTKVLASIADEIDNLDEMIANALSLVDIKQIDIVKLLEIYELLPSQKILKNIIKDLSFIEFSTIILTTAISAQVKADYLKITNANCENLLSKLDVVYEDRTDILAPYHFDYYYIVFDTMLREQTLLEAVNLFKIRSYSVLLDNQHSKTIYMDIFKMLYKIMVKYMPIYGKKNDHELADTYESLHEMFKYMMKKIEGESCVLRLDRVNDMLVSDWITVLRGIFSMSVTLVNNQQDVMGYISEAIEHEDFNFILNYFKNEENNALLQQILDKCVHSTHKNVKHQANMVIELITKFPHLKCDVEKVFEILTEGRADVNILFQLSHPECVENFNSILIQALLYGKDLKGEQRNVSLFITSTSEKLTYNQTVRLAAMSYITTNCDKNRIRELKELLLQKNSELYEPRYFNKSYPHSIKLRYTQALAMLFRLDPKFDDRLLPFVMDEVNQFNVRYISELIIAETIDPNHLLDLIKGRDNFRGLNSLLIIGYFVCRKLNDMEYIKKWIDVLIIFSAVRQITVRTAAQVIFIKFCEEFNFISSYEAVYKHLKEILLSDGYAEKFKKSVFSFEMRFKNIDFNALLSPAYILKEVPRLTEMNTEEYYKHFECQKLEFKDESTDFIQVCDIERENRFCEYVQPSLCSKNVQRKITPIREVFIDRRLLNDLPEELRFENKFTGGDIFVITTFVKKAANLGGICRSCEVFGVASVGLECLQSTQKPDFMSLSMGAEKWLNFTEIKDYALLSYLVMMRSKGYSIVGAEQTACSKPLNKVQFPKKMLLVLGHEKNGIPADIINILDMPVEIPQFGVVRSLNVHVTAALFMWEYCKQHLIQDANVSR